MNGFESNENAKFLWGNPYGSFSAKGFPERLCFLSDTAYIEYVEKDERFIRKLFGKEEDKTIRIPVGLTWGNVLVFHPEFAPHWTKGSITVIQLTEDTIFLLEGTRNKVLEHLVKNVGTQDSFHQKVGERSINKACGKMYEYFFGEEKS